MIAPEITLDAALRDLDSDTARYREQAIRNLAPALLDELKQPGPRWRATHEHPRGDTVRTALLDRLGEQIEPPLRGQAAVGLGTLGAAEVVDVVTPWLSLRGDDEDRVYLRQCALIALSFVGRAAAQAETAAELRTTIAEHVVAALSSPEPDLRFQAAVAIVELRGNGAEPALVEALHAESDDEAREGILEAIAYLDPPGEAACAALEAVVDGEDGDGRLGFLAAMTLAAARRASARPRLLDALSRRHERDDALEALAALGPAPDEATAHVEQLAGKLLLPAITRVRAAYALTRMVGDADPNPGMRWLQRLRWHLRPAVREAVADALANLDRLAAEER